MVTQGIIHWLRRLFGRKEEPSKIPMTQTVSTVGTTTPNQKPMIIRSVWDYLSIRDHTQVFHLINVIGFDEWVDMTEIRRRILEVYTTEYKNEKSLYPYLKTLVDLGLVENIFVGGRMRWRKKTVTIVFDDAEEEKATARVVSPFYPKN